MMALPTLGIGRPIKTKSTVKHKVIAQNVSLAIVGMDVPLQIEQIVEIASKFQPLAEEEAARLIEEVRVPVEQDAEESQKGKSALFWLHDTAVMGWQQKDEPALMNY
jgi:hypothetical protein